jgi:hypothetical protein
MLLVGIELDTFASSTASARVWMSGHLAQASIIIIIITWFHEGAQSHDINN